VRLGVSALPLLSLLCLLPLLLILILLLPLLLRRRHGGALEVPRALHRVRRHAVALHEVHAQRVLRLGEPLEGRAAEEAAGHGRVLHHHRQVVRRLRVALARGLLEQAPRLCDVPRRPRSDSGVKQVPRRLKHHRPRWRARGRAPLALRLVLLLPALLLLPLLLLLLLSWLLLLLLWPLFSFLLPWW
jgi:hypothetical protein